MSDERLITGRITHIRDMCVRAIERDRQLETGPNDWTDRHWLAHSVLNILDGKIDSQLIDERRDMSDVWQVDHGHS
jgi:hypothetical protein